MAETRLLLCDCLASMTPDAAAVSGATGMNCSRVHRHLCGPEANAAATALSSGDRVVIACGQEAAAFAELAEDLGAEGRLTCVDIRDRAGWSDDRATAPKMAALLAEGALPLPSITTMDVASEGVCLVYGASAVALPAAARLAGALTVTAMITDPGDLMPPDDDIDLVTGQIARVQGALGGFEVTIDRFATLAKAGRGALGFGPGQDGAASHCDIIVDLSGGAPLVPAPLKRDGYVRADPGDPLAVERALFDAAHLIGTFEKPLYVSVEPTACAHARARQTGCTRCLDLCPTSAITPTGDHVTIDPAVCAGCGACAAACPTAAITANDPPVQHLFRRMTVLSQAYAKAGGTGMRLLVHDDHGAEMIRLAARHGRGLPADVVPFGLPSLGIFGHAEMLAALGLGIASVAILAGPRTEQDPIRTQIALALAIAQRIDGISLLDEADPDALAEGLYASQPVLNEAAPKQVEPILAVGGRRDVTRLSALALAGGTAPEAPIALPEGAPYGTIQIDTQKCTLCLACVSLCPPGALGDNPDAPEVNFREEACVQCGLCATVCPETAITLAPQLDLRPETLSPRTLHAEEPFACIECGKLFGVKSTIEKITAKLSGAHQMFTDSDNVKLIQMCDDCRVRAQFHRTDNPFQMGDRPRVRTTDDYRDET